MTGRRRAAAGRSERRSHALRRHLLLASLLAAAAATATKVVYVQVVTGDVWAARAAEQHVATMELPAPRGTVYDRAGVPLAASRERYRVAVAPRELRSRDEVARLLQRHMGLSARAAREAVDPARRWVVLPGRWDEAVRDAMDDMPGLHFQQVMQRFYPHGALGHELIGLVNFEGEPLGGIELEFDSLLAGRPGRATVRRDSRGRPIPGQMLRVVQPVAGHDVYLTIDHALQQIAHDALEEALERTRASGGEIVLADPRTGEILAAAGWKGGRRSRNWSGATVPYEPGSIVKPFTVAAVLAERRMQLADSLYAEQGRWTVNGRTLTDVKPFGVITLADGLRQSSNIAIAKAATRLDEQAHYRYLRDFGFGSPTGIAYPSESGGRLGRPAQWSRQSQASLAIGYEISATPLQLVMAYGALANGGLLMEPRLVREVRSRDGRVLRAFEPRAVRRVVSEPVAAALREVLTDAVETGTGRAAAMGPLKVAGKTGTARVASGGRYVAGAYIATFAGYFPADDPQLVFLVKLEEPRGAYYGGLTAAPVTKATLEAALAARSAPLDRGFEARTVPPVAPLPTPLWQVARVAAAPARAAHVLRVAGGDAPAADASVDGAVSPVVPAVAGLPLRDAVRVLHEAGFDVRVDGTGRVAHTDPAVGRRLEPGATVRVVARWR
jgi:cell division protein FtsI (penicillin-binding protein 3)